VALFWYLIETISLDKSKRNMKNLYAYFGLIDLHDVDSPGHSLYQLGLLDSICETYGEAKFDFYSYYPDEVIRNANIQSFPNTELGEVFKRYRTAIFDKDKTSLDEVLFGIIEKKYDKLYLKARFRNLSTLAKKWKDAQEFERIIKKAINSGYSKDQIIILDTDLSLSDNFVKEYGAWVTILIPSIDFPGISKRFLLDCMDTHTSFNTNSVFYGNIDTSKYKAGNSKSNILGDVLSWVNSKHNVIYSKSPFYIICKANDLLSIEVKPNTRHIDRHDRVKIWNALEDGGIMLNVTKEKYAEVQFIPARIYEALIFGLIPVSYRFDFLSKTFSFNNLDDLQEIYRYLGECDNAGLQQAYHHYIGDYLKHTSNLSVTRF